MRRLLIKDVFPDAHKPSESLQYFLRSTQDGSSNETEKQKISSSTHDSTYSTLSRESESRLSDGPIVIEDSDESTEIDGADREIDAWQSEDGSDDSSESDNLSPFTNINETADSGIHICPDFSSPGDSQDSDTNESESRAVDHSPRCNRRGDEHSAQTPLPGTCELIFSGTQVSSSGILISSKSQFGIQEAT